MAKFMCDEFEVADGLPGVAQVRASVSRSRPQIRRHDSTLT